MHLTNDLQTTVRVHAAEFLRKEDNGRFVSASPSDLARYQSHGTPSPSPSYPVPDLHGTSGSPWNKALANIFVEDFVKSDLYEGEEIGFIKRLFLIHLNTLKRTHKRQALETEEEKAADADAYLCSKRESRRRNVRTAAWHEKLVG